MNFYPCASPSSLKVYVKLCWELRVQVQKEGGKVRTSFWKSIRSYGVHCLPPFANYVRTFRQQRWWEMVIMIFIKIKHWQAQTNPNHSRKSTSKTGKRSGDVQTGYRKTRLWAQNNNRNMRQNWVKREQRLGMADEQSWTNL